MKNKNYTEEYVSINGILQYFLHYPSTQEEVVTMLHGGPGIPNSYTGYYIKPYWDFCNVVYYDQRGSGKTQIKNNSKPEDLNWDALIEDLRQTIAYIKKKYQTNRVILAGHSFGSMLGIQYILKYPRDVIAYIGYGQVTNATNQDRNWYKHLNKTIEKQGRKKDIKKLKTVNCNFPNLSKKEFTEATLVLSRLEQKYGYVNNDFMTIYRRSPIMTFKDGLLFITGEKLNKKLIEEVSPQYNIEDTISYNIPIFYILGRHDEWTSSTIAAEYYEKITAPQKGLYWIENAGHMTDTDNPKAFCIAVKEIISKL